jgi:uncharacterized protein YndB with AHSA1/START domain
MIKVRCTCTVPASPDKVYALLIDPARRSSLSRDKMELISEEELPNGLRAAHFRMHSPKGGTVNTHNTTIERVANERIVFRTTVRPLSYGRLPLLRSGIAESESTITLEPHRDGALLVLEQQMEIRPLRMRLFTKVFGRQLVQRQAEASVERIRAQFLKWPTYQ